MKAASGLRMPARMGVIDKRIVSPERCTSSRTVRPVARFDSKYKAVHGLDKSNPSALIRREPGMRAAALEDDVDRRAFRCQPDTSKPRACEGNERNEG